MAASYGSELYGSGLVSTRSTVLKREPRGCKRLSTKTNWIVAPPPPHKREESRQEKDELEEILLWLVMFLSRIRFGGDSTARHENHTIAIRATIHQRKRIGHFWRVPGVSLRWLRVSLSMAEAGWMRRKRSVGGFGTPWRFSIGVVDDLSEDFWSWPKFGTSFFGGNVWRPAVKRSIAAPKMDAHGPSPTFIDFSTTLGIVIIKFNYAHDIMVENSDKLVRNRFLEILGPCLKTEAAVLYVQLAEFMVPSEVKDRQFVLPERSEGLTLSRERRGRKPWNAQREIRWYA